MQLFWKSPVADETPADKWARTSGGVRKPEADLSEHLIAEQKRRVQKDRTITLEAENSPFRARRAASRQPPTNQDSLNSQQGESACKKRHVKP